MKSLFMLGACLLLPLLMAVIWVRYSDYVKSLSPLGSNLTSTSLKTWNFGTLDQKLSSETWMTIQSRAIPDFFGGFNLLSICCLLLWFCRRQTVAVVLILIVLYLLPIAIFTNLYFIHNYYSYANGILLVMAAALIIGDVSTRGLAGFCSAAALLVLMLAGAGQYYLTHYLPSQGSRLRFQPMKNQVDAHTKPDDVLVFYGADWSSAMPFYLDRRALMLTNDLSSQKYRKAMESVRSYPIGGVFFCGETRGAVNDRKKILESLRLTGEGMTQKLGMCDMYFPSGF